MSSSTPATIVTTSKPVIQYEVLTDFGLMKFDSESVLGFWWEKIITGELRLPK